MLNQDPSDSEQAKQVVYVTLFSLFLCGLFLNLINCTQRVEPNKLINFLKSITENLIFSFCFLKLKNTIFTIKTFTKSSVVV